MSTSDRVPTDREKGRALIDRPMSITDHLAEFRKRIIIAAAAFLVSASAVFGFADRMAEFLIRPAAGLPLVYLSPPDLFLSYVRIAVGAGLAIAAPVILYQAWIFLRPALAARERRLSIAALVSGLLFFCGGVAFAYAVVLPFTIRFFISYSSSEIQAFFSIKEYLSFITDICLAFGVAFELPVLCALLGGFGILSSRFLVKGRRFAVLGIFLVAAVLTPPDVISQVMLALPMFALYELSVLAVRFLEALRSRARPSTPSAETEKDKA